MMALSICLDWYTTFLALGYWILAHQGWILPNFVLPRHRRVYSPPLVYVGDSEIAILYYLNCAAVSHILRKSNLL
jgi:type IV secretory pathway TrbD component